MIALRSHGFNGLTLDLPCNLRVIIIFVVSLGCIIITVDVDAHVYYWSNGFRFSRTKRAPGCTVSVMMTRIWRIHEWLKPARYK